MFACDKKISKYSITLNCTFVLWKKLLIFHLSLLCLQPRQPRFHITLWYNPFSHWIVSLIISLYTWDQYLYSSSWYPKSILEDFLKDINEFPWDKSVNLLEPWQPHVLWDVKESFQGYCKTGWNQDDNKWLLHQKFQKSLQWGIMLPFAYEAHMHSLRLLGVFI